MQRDVVGLDLLSYDSASGAGSPMRFVAIRSSADVCRIRCSALSFTVAASSLDTPAKFNSHATVVS